MKKTTCVLVGVLVLFLSGYALGRRHHVPRLSVDYESVDLLVVPPPPPPPPPPNSDNRQPSVLRASYSDQQTQTQGQQHDPNHGPLNQDVLDRYHTLRKAKSQNPGQGVTTQVETWNTCIPNSPVKITFTLGDNAGDDNISVAIAPMTN